MNLYYLSFQLPDNELLSSERVEAGSMVQAVQAAADLLLKMPTRGQVVAVLVELEEH